MENGMKDVKSVVVGGKIIRIVSITNHCSRPERETFSLSVGVYDPDVYGLERTIHVPFGSEIKDGMIIIS